MAALQFIPRLQQSISGKALLLLTSPEGRRSAGREMATLVPGEAPAPTWNLWWAALPSHYLRGRLGSCPAAVGSSSPCQAWGGSWRPANCPDPKAETLNSPCQVPDLRREQREPQGKGREPQGRGKEAARTWKAAASAVNTSHYNCFNDALRDRCGTQ